MKINVSPTADVAIGPSTSQGGPWLSTDLSAISAPNPFFATVNATGLTPGTYHGNIALTYNGSGSPFVKFDVAVQVVVGVATPNVVGLTQAAATTSIQGASLTVGTVTQAASGTVPVGKVISQSPVASTVLTAGSAVNLVISTGPALISVPNVVGMTQAAASTAIQGVGLAVGSITMTASNSVPAGSVISQNPVSGTQVSSGSAVNLVVSSGSAQVNVPNVVGMTQASATNAIQAVGLTVGSITMAASNSVPAGSVISQNPVPGTSVNAGSAVNLVISSGSGQVTVPNVVGMTQASASSAIQGVGLTVGNITFAASNSVPSGSVISQNPISGTQVSPGSAVNLVISSGSGQVTVPNVVGNTQSAASSAIQAAGLVVGSIITVSSDTVPSGSVISQSPAAGTLTSPGFPVNLVISSGPAQQTGGVPFSLPQLAFGGGWYTALYFSNTGSSATTIQVNFIGEGGSTLGVPIRVNGSDMGSVSSQSISLNPGATAIIEALNVGQLTQGWVEATLPAGVNGYAVFRQSVSGRADQEAVVPLTSESSQIIDFTYDDVGSLTTTFALVNPSNQQVMVTITAHQADGTPIGSAFVPLGPRTKQALAVRNLIGLAVGKRGWISLSADSGAISVLGLRFEGAAFTSIPVTARSATGPASTTFALPQLAFGSGWYTALYFTNTTASQATFPVGFIGDNGAPLNVPVRVNGTTDAGSFNSAGITLNPGQTVLLEALNVGSLVQGWVETTLPRGVVGYAVFRQSVSGRADQEAVISLESEANQTAELVYDNTDHVTTVAFLNSTAQQLGITITALGPDGSQAGTTQVFLPPRWKQEWTLTDLPGLAGAAGKRGSVTFSVSPGTISVLGLRFGGSAFTSIPDIHR